MMRVLAAITLALAASQAQASDLRAPPGLLLCRTLEDAASPTHAGCWFARGGQRVEIIAPMPTYTQLRLWSSDGSESVIVYAMRADADNLQKGSKP
ncbi:MAG: hypothetical protein JWO51_3549 [Rhodospirillales bacterium]|nr:hypothetical protein [Rhodospirillales bacterium]